MVEHPSKHADPLFPYGETSAEILMYADLFTTLAAGVVIGIPQELYYQAIEVIREQRNRSHRS